MSISSKGLGVPKELSLAEIFQLGYYWETKILLTAVRLDVFSVLNGKPKTAAETAARVGAHEPTFVLLLNALVAMGLLFKSAELYGNSGTAEAHLVRHSPQYIGHLLLLHDAEWNNWGHLEETIRSGKRTVDRHVFETDPDLGANVLAVLHRIGRQSGPELAKRLRLDLWTKSSIMVGLGEKDDEVIDAMRRLREAGVDMLTLGQYLAPGRPGERFLPVDRFVTPVKFAEWSDAAREMGFLAVASGPLVRSSYRAGKLLEKAKAADAATCGRGGERRR